MLHLLHVMRKSEKTSPHFTEVGAMSQYWDKIHPSRWNDRKPRAGGHKCRTGGDVQPRLQTYFLFETHPSQRESDGRATLPPSLRRVSCKQGSVLSHTTLLPIFLLHTSYNDGLCSYVRSFCQSLRVITSCVTIGMLS